MKEIRGSLVLIRSSMSPKSTKKSAGISDESSLSSLFSHLFSYKNFFHLLPPIFHALFSPPRHWELWFCYKHEHIASLCVRSRSFEHVRRHPVDVCAYCLAQFQGSVWICRGYIDGVQ